MTEVLQNCLITNDTVQPFINSMIGITNDNNTSSDKYNLSQCK